MLFSTKRSLLCISNISCMSLYASTIAVPIKVNNPITIGSSTKDTKVATDLTNTDYNYWSTEDSNTYVFHRDKDNSNKYWMTNKQVTIDKDYTLKLITNYNDGYDFVLSCWNTFTNNGNVIIDKYGVLAIDYNNTTTTNPISNSNNNGTIDIINGELGLLYSTTLNNNTKGTITLTDSSYIEFYTNSTLTNKGTIDISNITDLSN